MIKLGVNSVLYKEFDFATAVRHIALSGYDGVEISAIQGMCEHLDLTRWKEQAAELRHVVQENGLSFLSMEFGSVKDEQRLLNALEAAAEIGIPIINIGPGGKTGIEEDVKQSIDQLQRLSEKAAALGVMLCVKAHIGQAIHDTPTTLRAISEVSSSAFGIDMDPSHIYRANENPEVALPAVISRVKHIHIRDCKGREQGPGAIEMQACGRGDINLFAYCKAMVDNNYDGPVVLEVIGAKPEHTLAQISIIAAETYGYLNACLKQLGAR
ncbi:sugar phosphate isomerase/epimerase family protein [Paenibacillus radicis (ex Xue et al. 2023)]|uniref:Sugar phosphate isomerase/epimerase n=1 Tax=Paenibacillus radicis (ex Xue et al. 2023) TaxID=2972489 RepID=A0ABT1YD26_9BACL|nr:sugar phosphate isomerase/epimerase family protein [Paenibacillus radicis (ex Xue et al. 2023)]MCR8630665.1 sugar phosphate isomerase/epimerase [Paenibacillus radicis (ex Xue et al. 2023)]